MQCDKLPHGPGAWAFPTMADSTPELQAEQTQPSFERKTAQSNGMDCTSCDRQVPGASRSAGITDFQASESLGVTAVLVFVTFYRCWLGD